MKALVQVFALEWRALVRSRALAVLVVAALAWMFAMPALVKSDGTAEGARQMYVHYALGGVFALVAVALAAAAAGTLAKDRAAKRLQLTQVRPVRYFTVASGRFLALTSAGALVLALAAGVLALRTDVSRVCDHVLSPVMESPREEALRMYEVYMNDPETPREVKEAKKETIIGILTQKAAEHYQSVGTNEVAEWTFACPAGHGPAAVRLRFTNLYDTREDVWGEFALGGLSGSVSNITKAVVRVPLAAGPGAESAAPDGRLVFRNLGTTGVMLRPRRDINLLLEADSFGANLVRAWLELVAMLALLIAFAVFLGASLGRSVAVFTVMATLVMAVISPSVIEQCPDDLDTTRGDRFGLRITRFAERATRPFSSLSPLEALAADECVEWREALEAVAVDSVALPLLLLFAAAVVIPRKQDGL